MKSSKTKKSTKSDAASAKQSQMSQPQLSQNAPNQVAQQQQQQQQQNNIPSQQPAQIPQGDDYKSQITKQLIEIEKLVQTEFASIKQSVQNTKEDAEAEKIMYPKFVDISCKLFDTLRQTHDNELQSVLLRRNFTRDIVQKGQQRFKEAQELKAAAEAKQQEATPKSLCHDEELERLKKSVIERAHTLFADLNLQFDRLQDAFFMKHDESHSIIKAIEASIAGQEHAYQGMVNAFQKAASMEGLELKQAQIKASMMSSVGILQEQIQGIIKTVDLRMDDFIKNLAKQIDDEKEEITLINIEKTFEIQSDIMSRAESHLRLDGSYVLQNHLAQHDLISKNAKDNFETI